MIVKTTFFTRSIVTIFTIIFEAGIWQEIIARHWYILSTVRRIWKRGLFPTRVRGLRHCQLICTEAARATALIIKALLWEDVFMAMEATMATMDDIFLMKKIKLATMARTAMMVMMARAASTATMEKNTLTCYNGDNNDNEFWMEKIRNDSDDGDTEWWLWDNGDVLMEKIRRRGSYGGWDTRGVILVSTYGQGDIHRKTRLQNHTCEGEKVRYFLAPYGRRLRPGLLEHSQNSRRRLLDRLSLLAGYFEPHIK